MVRRGALIIPPPEKVYRQVHSFPFLQKVRLMIDSCLLETKKTPNQNPKESLPVSEKLTNGKTYYKQAGQP